MNINSILGRLFGLQIVRKGAGGGFNLYNRDYLRKICNPKTVVDVGVAYGTPQLYEAFPAARFVLIEPLSDYKPAIEKVLGKYNGVAHFTAVGAEKATIELEVDLDNFLRSTQFQRTELTKLEGHNLETRKVEMTTLDDLLGPVDEIARPLVLKIDTEGNELNVLKGAERVLKVTDYVILEASVSKRFEDSYEFSELIEFMATSGFALFSILSVVHPSTEMQTRFADLLFARNITPP